METLRQLRDSFMGYISPVKPRRAASPPKGANFLDHRRNVLSTEGPKAQKVLTGRVIKPSTCKTRVYVMKKGGAKKTNERSASGESDDDDEYEPGSEEVDEKKVQAAAEIEPEFDDDEPTFVNDDDDEYLENPKAADQYSQDEEESLSAENEDLEVTLVEDIRESEESEEISGDDKVRNYLSNRSVASTKPATAKPAHPNVHDYHEDETALWRQLEARSHEPILPAHWSQDFRTLGADFFSTNLEETFINSASGNDFQGIRALLTLINLGPRVRERRQAGLPREPLIEKAFNDYMKWAETDGGYIKKNFIPIHAVVAIKPGTPIADMSAALEAQLTLLALHHRRHLSIPSKKGGPQLYSRPPPLLYGILIVRSKFIICTMDSAVEEEEVSVRTLAAFDFQEVGMDVWNSFAVAIVAITIRNHLMRLAEMGEMESAEEEEETDPDL